MVTPPTAIPNDRKAEQQRKARSEEKKKKQNKQGTQWCSGITCVLAGLRAHYPEHQHKKKKEERRGEARRSEEKKTEKTSDETTHTFTHRLSTRSNHHRYSTMTQPCHKDTTLNQQCCDSKHKEKGGAEKQDTFHTPPHFSTHHTHGNTRQKRRRRQCEGGTGQCKMPDPIRRGRGDSTKWGTPHTIHHRPSTRATNQTARGR